MLAALALVATVQSQTLTLARGASVGGHRYWAVEDTTLDSNEPDTQQGGFVVLNGGPGKTILIKFGDLNRTLGPNKRITKATLVFTPSNVQRSALNRVATPSKPWNEGPVVTRSATSTLDRATVWAATWSNRRTGREPMPWQEAGAGGADDTRTIEGVTVESGEEAVTVSGLATGLQRQYERPWEAHGFAFWFANPVEFWSSNSREGRPRLIVEFEEPPEKSSADLSVVAISRTPTFDRYDSRGADTVVEQDGVPVPVMQNPPNGTTQKWPIENTKLNYTATIRNVGSAPAIGFTARWSVGEKPGQPVDVPAILQPGESTTLSIESPYRNIHSDHRLQPISLHIEPKGEDATLANNFLEIQEGALNFGITVDQSVWDSFAAKPNFVGSRSFEDWAQGVFRVWNESIFPYSRFSFAPDGVLERVRIQDVRVVPDGSPDPEPNLAYDVEFRFRAGDSLDPKTVEFSLIKKLSLALGLTDLSAMAIPPASERLRALGARRGGGDPFPGLMGGGDTRNEAMLPGSYALPAEPVPDPLIDASRLEETDLYSATDVAALNSTLGRRRGYTGEYLYDVPPTVLMTVMDYAGRHLPNVEIEFYQTAGGEVPLSLSRRVRSSASGTALLEARGAADQPPITTFTGHSLRPNLFGRIDRRGLNGAILVKATANGATDWTWIKVWHLVDAFHRGQKSVAMLNLRLNLPGGPLDDMTNHAKGNPATVDGAPKPEATDDDWGTAIQASNAIEIDLGRDRAIGEIRVSGPARGPMWDQFEIRVYGTGEEAKDARLWGRESKWSWAAANKSQTQGEVATIAYRGPTQRLRFIRLIPLTPSAAKFVEIAAIPIRFG